MEEDDGSSSEDADGYDRDRRQYNEDRRRWQENARRNPPSDGGGDDPEAGLGTTFFSVQNVPFFPVIKRERYVLFRSFLAFLATYQTQKNVTFVSVLFKRTERT